MMGDLRLIRVGGDIVMELSPIDGAQVTDEVAISGVAQEGEGVLESNQPHQAAQSQAPSDPNLSPETTSRLRRAQQPGAAGLFDNAVSPSSVRDLSTALPHFVILDVDTVRTDSRIEKYLRDCRIDTIYTPSSGLLAKESLLEAALQEPVHVIRRDGNWWCIAGDGLLAEAKQILKPPRYLPVLHRTESKKEALRNIAVVEQVIQPARHQMEQKFLKARVPVILGCATELPALFAQPLRDDQWATILRRSLRWFADAKNPCPKANPADGE